MQANNEFKIWEGVYASFSEARVDAAGPGFDGEIWRSRSLDSARACLAALKAGTRIPPLHTQRSTMLPPVAAMMLGERERLAVLDLGGGLGIGYMTLLESVPAAAHRIDYTIVEVSGICDTGRELFARDFGSIRFVTSPPEGARYDLVHCSSMLQYVEDWRGFLRSLGAMQAPYLLLSDIFAGDNPGFVSLQNYYGSRIEHWFLNYDELLAVLKDTGYELKMKTYVTARRLGVDEKLPMAHFPPSHRVDQTLHLLLKRREPG
jgi:putative methyltransferase (TIGR04325 family)